MRKQKQVSSDYTVTPGDDGGSLVLIGSSPQVITGPHVTGIAAVSQGFYFRVFNHGLQDSTFAPQNPQEPTYVIPVGGCLALELGPDGHWFKE